MKTRGRGWRSLRVQVLLWTVLPLIIMLIAVSLTGVGTHQASMRALAREDNQHLATALATSLAQQLGTYLVGVDAAVHLTAHHEGDKAMRDLLLEETSTVLGGIDIVEFDDKGQVLASSGDSLPAWTAAFQVDALPGAMAPVVQGETVLIPGKVPGARGALVAGVPLANFSQTLEEVASGRESTQIQLMDQAGNVLLVSGASVHDVAEHETTSDDLIVSSAPIASSDWSIRLIEPWHTSAVPLIRFGQAMPFVLAVAAAVSFLTLYFGLRLVVTPLRQLEAHARRIGEGDFAAAAEPVNGVDEIENVRIAMDQMAARLSSTQRSLERHLHAKTEAQEEERARLARELHDETVQGLVALDHRLQRAQRTLQQQPTSLKGEISEMRRMVHGEIDEVRRFSRALRSAYLEELGLNAALEMLCDEQDVEFEAVGEPRRLEPTVELSLYRIAQESINNARRHARAQHIRLHVTYTSDTITLVVHDDGAGFIPPAHLGDLSRDGHFGLMGIQERADLIGAQLSVISAPGEGTLVSVSIAI